MDDRKLPFMEHLGELRLRLRNSVIALLVACGVTYWWAKPLFGLLARPLETAYYEVGRKDLELHYGSLTEGFWVHFEVAIYAGVFLASPVIFYQIWKFIAPGLYDKEKRIAVPFAATSGLMFIGGALFAYYLVLPAAFRFFLSYSTENLGAIQSAFGNIQVTEHPIAIKETLFLLPYLEFARKMLLAFGLIFELPLGIFFLSLVGIVTHRSLWKWNKYWIILSFIVGGILTPGPDVMSQLLMALPLIVLYNVSIIIAWIVTRRREAAAAAAGDDSSGGGSGPGTDLTPAK